MRITPDWLRERDLYEQDVLVFERKWPDGMEVTEGNFLRAAKLGIDIGSLASRILSPHALKAYEKAIARALAAIMKAQRGPA